jgi:ribonuclease E
MKRMLINATQPEEVRIALVDGQKLYDLNIETPHHQKKKANIYKGTVTRIEPSLEAAFVDYGSERHGFLPFKEVAEEFFPKTSAEKHPNIKEVLKEGQEIIVQVQKEERGNKGAALTTQITLAGPYIVMMPNNPKAGGISRQIEGNDRSDTRESLANIEMPKGSGLIIRTAGVGKSTEELQWSISYLSQLWDAIKKSANEKQAPFLIHQESDIVILALRDYLRQDIGEIIIDDMETFQKAKDFIQHVMPQQVFKVKPYQDTTPLFTRFQVESQIETAYTREVKLPSGGEIVIDITEALTSIDINSSRSIKGSDIEETAYHTNLEAAYEIARQLRLRDLGGLIVIDFIDMHTNRNQRDIENKMREAVKSDRAKVKIGKISLFGLLEMSRQRLRPSIDESTQMICPRCKGVGVIRGVESLSLSLLRLIEEESMKEATRRITVQLPVDVASFLLNEKRHQIIQIEDRHKLHVMIVPNEHLASPNYLIERVRHGDEMSVDSSYKVKEIIKENISQVTEKTIKQKEEPVIKNLPPLSPPPSPKVADNNKYSKSLISRMWGALFNIEEEAKEKPSQSQDNKKKSQNNRNKSRSNKKRYEKTNTKNKTNSVQNNKKTPTAKNETNRKAKSTKTKLQPKVETVSTQQQPVKNTVEKEPKPKQRSRYNSRSYNGRRRKPEGAEDMSIHTNSINEKESGITKAPIAEGLDTSATKEK